MEALATAATHTAPSEWALRQTAPRHAPVIPTGTAVAKSELTASVIYSCISRTGNAGFKSETFRSFNEPKKLQYMQGLLGRHLLKDPFTCCCSHQLAGPSVVRLTKAHLVRFLRAPSIAQLQQRLHADKHLGNSQVPSFSVAFAIPSTYDHVMQVFCAVLSSHRHTLLP